MKHPEVQDAICELEEELRRSTTGLLAGLFRASVRRMDKIIRKAESKVALRAIELLWNAQGRLATVKEDPSQTHVMNQPNVFIHDHEDAQAGIELLKRERAAEERARRTAIDTSPIETR